MTSLLESSQVFNISSGFSKWRGLPILKPRWLSARRPSGEASKRKAVQGDVILRPTQRFLTTSPIPLGYLAGPLVCESRWSWDSGGASG